MMDFLYALRSFDGFWYYLTAIICVILIMAVLGFLMERSQMMAEKEMEDELSSKEDSTPLMNATSNAPVQDVLQTTPKGSNVLDLSSSGPVNNSAPTNVSAPQQVIGAPIQSVPNLEPLVAPTPVVEPTQSAPVIPTLVTDSTPPSNGLDDTKAPLILELSSGDNSNQEKM